MSVEREQGERQDAQDVAATDGRTISDTAHAVAGETACPLCTRRQYRIVSNVDRRGAPLRTVVCEICGLVWTNPRPTDAEVDRYYATEYRLDYSRSRTPTPRKLLRGFLGAAERRDWLKTELAGASRVLDIGCGAGEFVYLLRQHGLTAAGIEPGEEFAAFCRDVLTIPIQTATVERASVEPRSQSLITMFHMLEHVADPRRTLATIREWLHPDSGRLFVEVPNVLSTVQAPRHRFHYAHLYNYSAATLEGFGRTAGLRVVSSSETGDGGNILTVFARQDTVVAAETIAMPANVERTLATLTGHRTLGHYLGATPYRRAWQKLQRRRREDRLLAKLPTTEALLAWAERL